MTNCNRQIDVKTGLAAALLALAAGACAPMNSNPQLSADPGGSVSNEPAPQLVAAGTADKQLVPGAWTPPESKLVFDRSETYRLFYELESASLSAEARQAVAQAVAAVAADTEVARVEVSGHADESGPAAYNLRLSERRASSVSEALIAAGLPPELIHIIAHGEALDEASPLEPDLARRVEITLVRRVAAPELPLQKVAAAAPERTPVCGPIQLFPTGTRIVVCR